MNMSTKRRARRQLTLAGRPRQPSCMRSYWSAENVNTVPCKSKFTARRASWTKSFRDARWDGSRGASSKNHFACSANITSMHTYSAVSSHKLYSLTRHMNTFVFAACVYVMSVVNRQSAPKAPVHLESSAPKLGGATHSMKRRREDSEKVM